MAGTHTYGADASAASVSVTDLQHRLRHGADDGAAASVMWPQPGAHGALSTRALVAGRWMRWNLVRARTGGHAAPQLSGPLRTAASGAVVCVTMLATAAVLADETLDTSFGAWLPGPGADRAAPGPFPEPREDRGGDGDGAAVARGAREAGRSGGVHAVDSGGRPGVADPRVALRSAVTEQAALPMRVREPPALVANRQRADRSPPQERLDNHQPPESPQLRSYVEPERAPDGSWEPARTPDTGDSVGDSGGAAEQPAGQQPVADRNGDPRPSTGSADSGCTGCDEPTSEPEFRGPAGRKPAQEQLRNPIPRNAVTPSATAGRRLDPHRTDDRDHAPADPGKARGRR